jgi:replicative DNA helicase
MISIEDKLRNPKIEEALVGAVLINPDAFPGLSAWLAPADFQLQHLRSLWQAMGELQAGGLPIDLLTLSSRLEERDLLDQVGGLAYLTGLLNAPVTSLNAGVTPAR